MGLYNIILTTSIEVVLLACVLTFRDAFALSTLADKKYGALELVGFGTMLFVLLIGLHYACEHDDSAEGNTNKKKKKNHKKKSDDDDRDDNEDDNGEDNDDEKEE